MLKCRRLLLLSHKLFFSEEYAPKNQRICALTAQLYQSLQKFTLIRRRKKSYKHVPTPVGKEKVLGSVNSFTSLRIFCINKNYINAKVLYTWKETEWYEKVIFDVYSAVVGSEKLKLSTYGLWFQCIGMNHTAK
jgi:hypothetical protein